MKPHAQFLLGQQGRVQILSRVVQALDGRCLDMVGHPPVGGVHGHVQARVRPPTLAVSSLGLDILAVPGVTKEQAQTVARVKATFAGEGVEVRPRQRGEAR